MNIIGILTLLLAINTWGKAMFDLDVMPAFLVAATTAAPNITSTIAANTTPMFVNGTNIRLAM